MKKTAWVQINAKLLVYAILGTLGLSVNLGVGTVHASNITVVQRLLALSGVLLFALAAVTFLHVLTDGIRKTIIYHRLGVGRAAALQFILRVMGYLAIFFTTLDQIGVPVGHILVGSAVLGIILGVAAQQALGNFFASIVLIIAHPFAVGAKVRLISGALGGEYEGVVDDIGLTHTHLRLDDGHMVQLPNTTILTACAITVLRQNKSRDPAEIPGAEKE
jgi:small-conductance mechanosensitive channel